MENTFPPPHIQRFLAHFSDVRRSGDGWLAPCPVPTHGNGNGDQHPSLKIDIGHDGRIVVNCRASCLTEDVLAAKGLDWTDLFPHTGDAVDVAAVVEVQVKPPLDPEICHKSYQAALGVLTLSDDHRENLRQRGLSDSEIDNRDYRTLRNVDRGRVAAAAFAAVKESLYSVPGFVRGAHGPTIQGRATGLLVPVRNGQGRIHALKIRQAGGHEPKYMLLTSGNGGPAPSELVHTPLGTKGGLEIRVTEGELKADVAAALSSVSTIGIPGVSMWLPALSVLAELGPKKVVVAFDALDVKSRLPIREKCGEFVAALRDAGFAVELEDWDGPHKGIDDLLAAGGQPRRLTGDEVDRHLGAADWLPNSLAKPTGLPPELTPGMPPEPSITRGAAERTLFPVGIFPPPLVNFAQKVASSVGCAVDIPAVAMLTAAGAAIGASRSVQVKAGWEEKPCLYSVIVSPSGSAKTPAMQLVMEPHYEEQARIISEYKKDLKRFQDEQDAYESGSNNTDTNQSPSKKPQAPPLPKQIFVGDVTTEALAAALQNNEKGTLLFRDEIPAWVRSWNMYRSGGADNEFFLAAWSGTFIKVDRRTRQQDPIAVPHPFISVLGGIQPDILSSIDLRNGKQDGFLPRLLFAHPSGNGVSRWSDIEVEGNDKEPWRQTIVRLLNLRLVAAESGGHRPKAISLSHEAKGMYIAWFNRMAEEMEHHDFPPVLIAAWVKMRAYVARFALIIHMLRVACGDAGDEQSEGSVDEEDIRRAILVAEYFMAQARHIYASINRTSEDRGVEQLITWMRKRKMKECNPRDAVRAEFTKLANSAAAIRLFEAAAERGYGEVKQAPAVTGKGGARSPRFVLTKLLLSQHDTADVVDISSEDVRTK